MRVSNHPKGGATSRPTSRIHRTWRAASILAVLSSGFLFDACSAHLHFAITGGGKDFLSQLLNPANFIAGYSNTTTTGGLPSLFP